MGVYLRFETSGPLDPVTLSRFRDRLRHAVDGLGNEQPWILCDRPSLEPPDASGRIVVASMLNLLPYREEMEAIDRAEADEHDLHALLGVFEELSATFGLDGDVRIDDEPIGRIDRGQADASLVTAIDALAEFPAKLDPEDTSAIPPRGPHLRLWPGPRPPGSMMDDSTNPTVGVVMGSRSDWETMRHAVEVLDALSIPREARVVSAHRTPRSALCLRSGS